MLNARFHGPPTQVKLPPHDYGLSLRQDLVRRVVDNVITSRGLFQSEIEPCSRRRLARQGAPSCFTAKNSPCKNRGTYVRRKLERKKIVRSIDAKLKVQKETLRSRRRLGSVAVVARSDATSDVTFNPVDFTCFYTSTE